MFDSILSSDLSIDRDPDDWFDAMLFLTLDGIRAKGVVLEHYATDEVEAKAGEFLHVLGRTDVPVARGVQEPLVMVDHVLRASPYRDGARLMIELMERTADGVRLFAVGSLRNEALAYQTNPSLFLEKVERLYFAGGRLDGSIETNIWRDPLAADIVINLPVPKVWVPCTHTHRQKLSAGQERRLKEVNHSIAAFLIDALAAWRAYRGSDWLQKTEQTEGQGKNLWSLPLFMQAVGVGGEWMVWDRGTLRFDLERKTWFEQDPSGPDIMLRECDGEAICEWLVDWVSALAAGSARRGWDTCGR